MSMTPDKSASDKIAPDKEALMARARAHRWFHRIRLAEDFETPGPDATPAKLRNLDTIGLPADMTGLRVLDIGAWDGFFTFEAERRGASVMAIDHVARTATGFDIAAQLLDSKAEWQTRNIYALDPAEIGSFDIVLCLGVIYHLRHILLGLDRVRAVMKPGASLFVETTGIDNHLLRADGSFVPYATACPGAPDSPLLQIYAGRELGGDATNIFAPNAAGLRSLLTATEFETQALMVSPPGFASRIIARATAVSNPEVAFYRDRDEAVLTHRTGM